MTAHDKDNSGVVLRRAREGRGLTLGDVAALTRVPRAIVGAIEAGDLATLPADVYARGFVRAFARAVGASEDDVLALFDRDVAARRVQAAATPPPVSSLFLTDDETAPRRGVGIAVFVLLLILLATITLSLLLRRPPPSGEGLSLGPTPAVPAAAGRIRADPPRSA